MRRMVGARHGVIHERAREQLPVGAVMGFLHQALAEPLHDAALHLALHNDRVHDIAEIPHHRIAHDRRDTRLRVDLDLADMATVGIGRRASAPNVIDVERLRRLFRQAPSRM